MTTTTVTCPNCGTVVTVAPAPVRCACCRREIQGRISAGVRMSDGQYGALCEDCSQRVSKKPGPSETKGE